MHHTINNGMKKGKEILKGQSAKSFKVSLKTKTGHNFDNWVEREVITAQSRC